MMEWMFPNNGPLKCENTMENDVLKLWRFQKLLTKLIYLSAYLARDSVLKTFKYITVFHSWIELYDKQGSSHIRKVRH